MSLQSGVVVVGLNHHTTPLDLRERLTMDLEHWKSVYSEPSVLLNTCNRVEVYAWAERRAQHLLRKLARALSRASGVPYADLAPCLFQFSGVPAIRHLVRVAAGLDSLVLGDEQIRSQVGDACELARGGGKLPSALQGVFRRALEAGRTIRSETLLGQHPSVADAAIRVATEILQRDEVTGRQAVVLGAGAMAQAAARALLSRGWHVIVLNRTPEHAVRLAQSLGAEVGAGQLEALSRLLAETDLLVGATASHQPVVLVEVVEEALRRRNKPLFIFDIAVPRDVDPRVRSLSGVRLFDLSDLEGMCPVDVSSRRREIERAEALAADAAERIQRWLRLRSMVPAIVDLRRQGDHIRELELQRAQRRLRDLTPDQRQAVEAVTGAIVNKLLHGPTILLREAVADGRSARRCRMIHDVLRLDVARHPRSIDHMQGER